MSTTTIRVGESRTCSIRTLPTAGIPLNGNPSWSADPGIAIEPSADGLSCNVTGVNTGTFSVRAVASPGEGLEDLRASVDFVVNVIATGIEIDVI